MLFCFLPAFAIIHLLRGLALADLQSFWDGYNVSNVLVFRLLWNNLILYHSCSRWIDSIHAAASGCLGCLLKNFVWVTLSDFFRGWSTAFELCCQAAHSRELLVIECQGIGCSQVTLCFDELQGRQGGEVGGWKAKCFKGSKASSHVFRRSKQKPYSVSWGRVQMGAGSAATVMKPLMFSSNLDR